MLFSKHDIVIFKAIKAQLILKNCFIKRIESLLFQVARVVNKNPGYVNYREICGLPVPSDWNDKPTDISQQNWDNLKLVYNSVTDIDAFTGGVSEDSIPDGVVGRTFGCIIANQFQNLMKGDRFFFTHKENGIKKERGWSANERKVSQIHSLGQSFLVILLGLQQKVLTLKKTKTA